MRDGEQRGLLYFAWQQQNETSVENRKTWADEWRKYADEAVGSNLRLAELHVRKLWIHDDLFLFVSFPEDDRAVAEQHLFELAYGWQQEWASGFGLANSHGQRGYALHAGAAVISHNPSGSNADQIYRALKRVIAQGEMPDALERILKRKTLDRFLTDRSIYPVFQPIRTLAEEAVFGYEALTRCPENDWFKGPFELFSFAESEGISYALDRLAREKSISAYNSLRNGRKLFVNLITQVVEDPGFMPGLTRSLLERYGLEPSDIVFEITERSSINDFAAVKKALGHYRSQGYQIAIDDVGAGYSSLQSIVELRPDFIKVDRSIIQHIDKDDMKEHTLYTLQQLADKMGISVIAEGIEREEELLKIRKMGIPYGQGYLLGRPAAP